MNDKLGMGGQRAMDAVHHSLCAAHSALMAAFHAGEPETPRLQNILEALEDAISYFPTLTENQR